MLRRPLSTALLLALAAPALAERLGNPEITLYSGDYDVVVASEPAAPVGYALVRERLRYSIQTGETTLTLAGLPHAIDAAGVTLRADGAANVLSQRYDFALPDQQALLRRALGRTVTVEQATGGSRETYTGTLLAAGQGLTLALPDGRIKVLAGFSSFELAERPDGLVAEPTLRWQVRATRAGRSDFRLDYPTAGLAWRAEYLATLSEGRRCRLALSGAAQVVNRSGASFDDATLTLVAGEPRRTGAVAPAMKTMAMEMRSADAVPSPEISGEYHAYRLPSPVDLPDGSIQRVPLMADAGDITCERRYETQPAMGLWRPPAPIVEPQFGANGEQPVRSVLAFDNAERAGLGRPLPAGRVRVLQHDGHLLGEAPLGHTPAGEMVELELGSAFDLRAERTTVDFRLDRSARRMSETIEVSLRNAKAEPATVRVVELLPRWSEWDIVDAPAKWQKLDAQRIAFDVPVAANGEATVRYTVQYRWAPEQPVH
jgi:hypothetical protein